MAESIETKHENWLRVVWGLLYVREGLQGYVDTKGKEQYETFMNNVNGKCNNQTCNQCQVNSKCQNGTTKVTEKSRFRPGHFCDEMNKNIQNYHVRIKPLWTNTDSTKWQDPHDGYWEVAKCYLSTSGYLDKTGPNQVDASGLLSICMNSAFIKQHIGYIQHFEEVRDIRNKTLHDACYELDGQTADVCLDKMITVLEDQQELIYDAFAKQAASQIRKIKAKTENPPAIMTEPFRKLLRMNLNVEMALTEIEKLMNDRLRKNLQQLVVDEVKREVRHSLGVRGDDKREQVKTLCQRLAKYYQTNLNSAPISPLISDKDERLDKFYVPPMIVKKDPRKVGAAEKKDFGTRITSDRQVFCKETSFRENVFIVGEAGTGKTAFTSVCALKWANYFSSAKTSPQTQQERFVSNLRMLKEKFNGLLQHFYSKPEEDDQFQDETLNKEIDILFHLTLRDSCDLCDLTDMIRDQLIDRIYQHDEIASAYSTLESALSNKRCVIIADGLDEWTHPNGTCSCKAGDRVFPSLAASIDATVLITSRPWRMSQQRVKDTHINKYFELQGAVDINLLIEKVLNSLNETVTEKKTLEEFLRFVDIMKLKCLLSVPIITMLLVCLWFDGMPDSSSLCDIYAYTIEMMFSRKDRHVPVVTQTDIQLPRCFKDTNCVQNNFNIVQTMAELAFTKLFSNDRTSCLVFKDVDILAQDNLVFLLKSGILQETKSASLIRRESSYSFIHKTVQEFLAAVHMYYNPDDFYRILTPFYEKNGEMSDISQVFTFMCGLNIELANELSAMISNSLCLDNQSFTTETRVIQIQSTIVSGYKEAKASQVLGIKLSQFSFDFSYTTDTEILDDLLSINKSNVRYIKTSTDNCPAKLQEVFCSSSETLTNIKIFSTAGQFDLLACNRLKCLSIYGTKTTDIVVNTSRLIALDLNCVSELVEYSILLSFDGGLNELEHLKIKSITDISLLRLILPQLIHLQYIAIDTGDLGDDALLLPHSMKRVELSKVKMSARSLKQMIGRLEERTEKNDVVTCKLLKCTVEPNSEYEAVISDVKRRADYCLDIGHKYFSLTCQSSSNASEETGDRMYWYPDIN